MPHGLSISKRPTPLETRVKISSFVAAMVCLLLSHETWAQTAALEEGSKPDLTLEQKVGQVMIWSFGGTDLNPDLQRTLTKYQPGGLVFFRRNVKTTHDLAKFNAELQKLARKQMAAPLFLMVDQEGGLVTRVRTNVPMPSALALARTGDSNLVETYGRATGDVLSILGFNMNLAPVLDISNPLKDTFIGNRTFGNDPDSVTELSMAYSKGLNSGGVLPTAKHFPGHGGTQQDSHQTVPKKMSSLEELKGRDFVPFREFAQADFPRAMMTAHLALPNIDATGTPATYSKIFIRDQLRENLGYKGLIMTDDLEMSGASVSKDVGERAVRALLAGNDMLMLAGPPSNQRRAYQAVLEAVRSGRIPESQLNESVDRILASKARLRPVARPESRRVQEAFKKLDELSKSILKRNFKYAADSVSNPWPAADRDTRATVFSASYLFFRKFQIRYRGRSSFFHLNPETLENARSELASGRMEYAVFFASGSKTAHWLNSLADDLKSKIIVVNCNHPGEIESQGQFLAVLNVNSYFTDSGTWLADLLNSPPETRAPADTGDSEGQ